MKALCLAVLGRLRLDWVYGSAWSVLSGGMSAGAFVCADAPSSLARAAPGGACAALVVRIFEAGVRANEPEAAAGQWVPAA